MISLTKILLLCAALLLPSTVRAEDDWTPTNTAMQASFLVLVVADWGQTRWALDRRGFVESNPFLGPYPSGRKLTFAVTTTMFAHTAISLALPPRYRTWWQAISLGLEAGAVTHNVHVLGGLHFKF